MKKFFRVALVCALAGATLLYTGCTKDYSEDLNSLQKKVEEQGATIKSQGDQIADLLKAKQALEQADADAMKLIEALQGRASDLDKKIDSLKSQVNGDVARIDSLINALSVKADSLRSEIDSLKNVVNGHKTMLDSLAAELAKKADKSYVDTELGKKADQAWVEAALANKADAQALIDTAASLRRSLMELNKTVSEIKGDLADLTDEVDDIAADVDTLQSDMNKAKDDIKKAQQTADTAVAHAARALAYAKGVESYLKENYYTAKTIDKFLAAKVDTAAFNAKVAEIDKAIEDVIKAYQDADTILDQKIDSLDKKIDAFKKEYEAAIDSIWKKFAENDLDLQKLINRVQSIVYLPEFDDKKITLSWAQMYAQNIFDTRDLENPLPPSFDMEAWEEFLEELFEDVPAGLEKELKKAVSEVYSREIPTPEEYDGEPESAATPIPEQSHVKYRVYGNDARTIVEGLVQAVKDSQNLLAFDVIRVKTRVNLDGVKLNIVDAKVDEMYSELADASVIDLTVMPEGLPADFWLYAWDVKNFMNPSLHPLFLEMLLGRQAELSNELYTWLYQQYMECVGFEGAQDGQNGRKADGEASEATAEVEADTEFPAFSASLVLTDPEQSRMITSSYYEVVPAAKSDEINLWVKRNDMDITGKVFGDTVEICYADINNEYEVLEGAQLMFNMGGKDYTVEEFAALGMNLGDPQARFFAVKDYSESIAVKVKGATLPEKYLDNRADDVAQKAYAKITGEKANPDGVGAKEYVVLVYFVGPAATAAVGLVKVVPFKIPVEVDLWETEDLEPFTWDYWKDAEIDAALLAGDTSTLYKRDAAVAVLKDPAKWEEDCKKANITIKDLAEKVPVDTATFFYITYVDGAVDTVMLKDLLAKTEGPKFNIYPIINEDGTVTANVTDFPFYDYKDTDHGSVTKISYVAVYNLPSDETPAVEITVFGKITVADRNRETIVVDLPETFEPFVVNYKKDILDTLRNADTELVPEFPAGTYEAHSLPDSALIDAYKKDLYGRTDSLTMTVDDVVTTRFARLRIITTVDEQHENAGHVLDYNTDSDFNVSWAANKVIEPYQTFKSIDTLWYGQVVIVNKTVRLDVDGIFEFERIPEYVAKEDDDNYYTTLQPWWKPDAATQTPYNVPANGYDAHEVLLNQHFRVVDVLKSIEEGQKVVCTEIATTDEVEAGDLTEDYKDILARIFKLEEDYANPGSKHPTIQVDSIPDPRNIEKVVVEAATGVKIDTNNVVEYYSESPEEDAIGNLYAVNSNGSKVLMTTNFNRGDAAPSPRLEQAGVVVENYENYVIKLFDPLREIEPRGDVSARINVNNSIITETSIYQFIQLKDKRDKNLIDYKQTDEGHYGWVKGNNNNGFETGVYADDVYSLTFTNEMEYLTEISDETKARISFDAETGKLTYDNTLQTQLAKDIDIKLTIKIEYPWGTKSKDVVVTFYNKPVGE